MSFFQNLRTAWKNMPTNRKVKIIVEAVCDFGGTLMATCAGDILAKDRSKLERVVMGITAFGLGSAIGEAASKQIDPLIDLIVPEKKVEVKEETENA